METIRLSVETRTTKGKEPAGKMRQAGKVPGVFYGPGKEAAMVTFDAKEFRLQLAKVQGAPLLTLASQRADLDGKLVLLKEIQRHPVKSDVLHVDFYEVDESKPLVTAIPVHLTGGRAKGVVAGGVLQAMRREIVVECLPRDLPAAVEIDVSNLNINDAVHIEDLRLPEGVQAIADTNFTLVTVQASRITQAVEAIEEQEAVEAEAAEAEAAEAEAEATPAAETAE